MIQATTAENHRFLSKMMVIITERISEYSVSILNKIFKLEGRKSRTSLKMAKLILEETVVSVAGKFKRYLNFHPVSVLSLSKMSELDVSEEAID